MNGKTLLLAAVFSAGLAGGCATNQETGTLIGGILGGVAGSNVGRGSGRTAATVLGTVAGAAIGSAVGQHMDATDRLMAQHALENNPTNLPSTWVNPDSGAEYSVTPRRTYQVSQGEYCREYQTDVTIGGRTQQAYGTACRQPDGSWEIAL